MPAPSARQLLTWYTVHKWTSLVCTLFLLVICLTGLPLIFHHEIEHWLYDGEPYAELPADAPRLSIDAIHAHAQAVYPNHVLEYTFIDDEEPQVMVWMSPGHDLPLDTHHPLKFDARTGALLEDGQPFGDERFTFMGLMYTLHVDWFAGLAGQLFLGAMGLLFVAAIVSGVVLYGRIMRHLEFGTLRKERPRRIRWLDLHNLLGAATLVWALVVGITGVINELSVPMFQYWQRTDVAELVARHHDATAPTPARPASADHVIAAAQAAVPGNRVVSLSHPGNAYATPDHYMVWTEGNTPLTSHLFTPVLVHGATGAVTAVAHPPWYLVALALSQPLHFGDYGGLPLQILWAVLDLLTIVVLITGLYLWLARRRATDARMRHAAQHLDRLVTETVA